MAIRVGKIHNIHEDYKNNYLLHTRVTTWMLWTLPTRIAM